MITVAQLGPPVDLRPLMARERAALVQLLADLRPDTWTAPTACPGWTVRDVAAHLLHDDLRRLSHMRDGHDGGPRRRDGETLAAFINRTNDQWVATASFLSPGLLVELLMFTGGLVQAMWAEADLDALGIGVSWAGVDPAPVWLDAAREYTEAWTHQQQIRDATGRPGLGDGTFVIPVIDTMLRALPFTYRSVRAPTGTAVRVTTTAEDDPVWSLVADVGGWSLSPGRRGQELAAVRLDADTLWRLATGGISRNQAAGQVTRSGAHELSEPFLEIVSVVR